ncbi:MULTISPECIES: hypothetical protein [unclassified Crossiella]|uniref:hypothetical protein n=1 Tax=unclassified Crossiella TaxID=2620835 RepID=UPI001FFF102E|nr:MULTISPECIES: hypothetical protein [unclassified Crossiella]MCK2245444.1 hypothetical protein [Crossiella sp. S99.2]MCK2259096.1 hypothetical protein [Crossiella sp. S99.1]
MAKRDRIDDIVDIVLPMPAPLPEHADEHDRDGHGAWCDQVTGQRRDFEENLRFSEEHSDSYVDPLLEEIHRARQAMLEAEARMRLLVAYGREFITPQPYPLKDLAAATGMSISGIRSAYTVEEIATVARRIGRQPRPRTSDTGTAS